MVITIFVMTRTDTGKSELNLLLFRVAQELRFNHDWLSEVAVCVSANAGVLPAGSLEIEALVDLANREYGEIVEGAHGEEKYIYQEILKLKNWGQAFGSPHNYSHVQAFERRSPFTLHDMLFLNEFIRWYLTPLMLEYLNPTQIYSLGWAPFPGDHFEIGGIKQLQMEVFVEEGKPITEFGDYLGLID